MRPNSSPGPRGPENREVESLAIGTEITKLGESRRGSGERLVLRNGCSSGSLAQDGGGQGVLSHPKGEG